MKQYLCYGNHVVTCANVLSYYLMCSPNGVMKSRGKVIFDCLNVYDLWLECQK